ncbi:MAG: DJ-1/PfpI family protein [Oscillospiraceae bacterium]|nr:DJ-1/PfpI family protein [Oscillospiraceae bacterium]
MVCILLGTGFEEAEALVPADLLRRAKIPVCLAGVAGLTVTGAHNITVTADCPLSNVNEDELELVFLPGGLGGVDTIKSSPAAMELIRRAHAKGIKLAAICAAPTILNDLGMLDGKRAVCYPSMQDQLTGALPHDGSPVVEDGTIITGEAAGSAFTFGFKLIEALRGAEAAEKVRRAVHYHG